MRVGKSKSNFTYTMTSNYKILTNLMGVQNENDVGVIFDEDLNFQEKISSGVSKGNSIMVTIRRTYLFSTQNPSNHCLQP